MEVILESTLTRPKCGHQATEVMPTNACRWFYECTGCGELLKPKQGNSSLRRAIFASLHRP